MNSTFKMEALFDSVIIEQAESSEELVGNIIIPDLGKDKNLRGTIVAVGPGSYAVTGEFIPTMLKVGDKVILPSMGFSKVEYNDKEYLVGNEKTLIAKIIE